MPDEKSDALTSSQQRQNALSRWDSEGGAGPYGSQKHAVELTEIPPLTNAELVQLRIRVIALENLMIMLLAEGSDKQRELAREMATYISPQVGFHSSPSDNSGSGPYERSRRSSHSLPKCDASMSLPTAPSSKVPYKCTPIFDETTLPAGLRREHRTKAGVWGVIRVFEGRLRYQVLEPNSEMILEPGHPGLLLPDQPHLVEPLGPMRMQVEFYNRLPDL